MKARTSFSNREARKAKYVFIHLKSYADRAEVHESLEASFSHREARKAKYVFIHFVYRIGGARACVVSAASIARAVVSVSKAAMIFLKDEREGEEGEGEGGEVRKGL